MKLKHTPTPWRIQGEGTLLHPVTLRALTTTRIETTLGSLEILDETNEPEANAPFIVMAVNNHERLLAALKTLERGIRLWISEGVSYQALEEAQAAIRAAEETKEPGKAVAP